ncbi:MAG: hypothetical protein IJK86_01465 [Lachnospiraceae bacterium]|nr:hypothetical protein [Lachnospiraceae bacterium]
MNMNDIYEYLKKKHVGEENAVFSKEPENYLCSFRWFWDFVASSAPNRRHFSGFFPKKRRNVRILLMIFFAFLFFLLWVFPSGAVPVTGLRPFQIFRCLKKLFLFFLAHLAERNKTFS